MKKPLFLITLFIILTLSCMPLNPGQDFVPAINVQETINQQVNNFVPTTTQVGMPASGDLLQQNANVYFPRRGDDPASALAALYMSTSSTLDIAIYSLTHPQIVKAIGDTYKRGIPVRIITDRIQAAGTTQKHAMNDLLTIGIPIKVDSHSGLMHLKMSIVDNNIATTGSYNYSKGASEDNDEILLVIKEPWFAQICQMEFDRMWNSPQFTNLEMSY